MTILTLIAILLGGGALNFIKKPEAKFVYGLAKGYIFLMLFVSAGYWPLLIVGIKSAFLSLIIQWGNWLGYLLLGYLITYMLVKQRSKDVSLNKDQLRKIAEATLWGISILTANLFIMNNVSKVQYFNSYVDYFTSSGYAVWFLYFIITAETLCALGILLNFKLKTGRFATIGLILIMLGVVYTNWHNKSPFSWSFDAVTQLISLSLMLIIYYFEKKLFQTKGQYNSLHQIRPAGKNEMT
jgi:uncharacterized membrane protein YphA (DoxX/SURF4 family)